MRRLNTFSVLFFGGLFLAACGGGEQESADMGDMSDSEDMAAAPASELSCYSTVTMAEAQERPSPLESIEFSVGGHDALLCYGAPSARGRDIMGGLVPFGEPWRMGANEPTTLHLAGPATIQGVAVEPGSYSIYAIPGESEWEIVLNSTHERWGIPIDESVRASDVGSFTVEPESMDESAETLHFSFEPTSAGMGDVIMEWENTRVSFHAHPAM
ncbi:MAG: DUF2911 domain-containing protein [Gemmatimonadetes bacterium]|nr:DUF2911 domain-containing protein [Gemmatimonadota bacterium]NNL30166.1 DUF2911 domain-containing protein [Gemmatimonadota bacterium]